MTELKRPNLFEALKSIMRVFGAAVAVLYLLRSGSPKRDEE
jgi:hypothetical protein